MNLGFTRSPPRRGGPAQRVREDGLMEMMVPAMQDRGGSPSSEGWSRAAGSGWVTVMESRDPAEQGEAGRAPTDFRKPVCGEYEQCGFSANSEKPAPSPPRG